MVRRIARLLGRLTLGFVGLSLAWVLLYRFVAVPGTVPMVRDRLAGLEVRYQWVPLASVSPALVRSVIAAEDSRFCSHNGFDLEAINKAMERNAESSRLRGGSTISQQVAKNVFLWPARSWLRKGLEAWFTLLIEPLWGKRRIMETYLNIVELGPGVYGAEAGARHHFGTGAGGLSANQAARLAAVLPQPIKRNAGRPGPFVRRHAGTIERRARVVARDGLDGCLRG